MRRTRRVVCVMALACLAGEVRPAVAADDEDFSGYRIPTQDWFGWRARLQGSLNSNVLNITARQSSWQQGAGDAAVGVHGGHDSETWQRDWNADVGGFGTGVSQRLDEESAGLAGTEHMWEARDDQRVSGQWHVAGGMRFYPAGRVFGTTTRADGLGSHGRTWSHLASNTEGTSAGVPLGSETIHDVNTRLNGYVATFDLEEGAGRVRDATGVYEAWILERRLRADGVLARPLSPPARSRLAQLFSVQYGYGRVHDRPDKAFWDEVEKLARDDGGLTEAGFTAYSALHAVDPLLAPSSGDARRLIGLYAGPVLRGSYRHDLGSADYSTTRRSFVADTIAFEDQFDTSSELDREVGRVTGGVAAEWHRPLGVRWQIDADGLALAEVRGIDRYSLVQSSASVVYRLGERWIADGRIDQAREVANDGFPTDRWSVVASAALRYYLEDHWSIGLGLGGQQYRNHLDGNGQSSYYRQQQLTAGITYGAERFDAPGLIAPVRPLPPTGL